MRTLRTLLILSFPILSLFSASLVAAQSADPLPLIDANYESAYKLTVRTERGASHGSAFALTHEGHLLTNHHVIDDAVSITLRVKGPDGKMKTVSAEVLAKDEFRDIALIKANTRFVDVVQFANPSEIKHGDLIYNIGFPYDLGKVIGRGYLMKVDIDLDGTREFGADRMIAHIPDGHGTSGSGLFSQRTGFLVGIMKAYVIFGKDSNSPLYARMLVPITEVKAFLREHLPAYFNATP